MTKTTQQQHDTTNATMTKSTPPLDDKESTPLLFSPKGGGRLDPNNREIGTDEGPMRRRVGQQQVRTNIFVSPSEFLNYTY